MVSGFDVCYRVSVFNIDIIALRLAQLQLAIEVTEQGDCGQRCDYREGVVAFMEERKPDFERR